MSANSRPIGTKFGTLNSLPICIKSGTLIDMSKITVIVTVENTQKGVFRQNVDQFPPSSVS